QWMLNANFLMGNQYCDINIHRGGIEQTEPVYDWLEREVFNQIAPLIDTRIANLKKISYLMKVKPATNELDDYAKAEVSTDILQYVQKNTDFEAKKNTMIYWNELCGNCFWLSWWDKDKGDVIGEEDICGIAEDGSETHYKKIYRQGDIDYGLLTPYEVFPESIFKQGIEAQRSIILEQVKTVDDIYDLYGIEVEGSEIETFELTPVACGGGYGYESTVTSLGHRSIANAQKVITYLEKPSKRRPNGRMIIIVGDTELVYYGDLPYGRIPIIQTVCREVAGQFFGRSVIEDLIPRQRAYNGCINRIHEYIKRVAIGGYMVEKGSVDIDDYEENGQAPGALLEYERGSTPPVPIQIGNLPSEMMTERHNLKTDMEYVAGTSQLMVNGATPTGITSGTAIENLMEIDNTRLALTGDHIRNSIQKLAVLWLEMYKQYATMRRVVNYVGSNNIGKALVWCSDDINSYDVEYVTENELVQSEEVQKQNFFNAYNMGLFTDSNGVVPQRVKQKAQEYMRSGNYTDIMNIDLLQLQAAQRENSFFEEGILPEVSEFDNHTIHIEEHKRYILQMDFQLLKIRKPEYAAALENHLRLHLQAETEISAHEILEKRQSL
ncbi:MAG: hypothetical protein ACI4RS_05135, partial [Monoglobaceae bacterium]